METAIDTLISQCRSGATTQKVSAIQELIELKGYSAAPVVTDLLQSPDSTVRSTAAHALGYLGMKEPATVGAALVNLLRDAEDIVRVDAVGALGMLRFRQAVDSIIALLADDPEPVVRASAAETLGDLGDTKALESLELALLDPDESVRAYAANSMGLIGTGALLSRLQGHVETEPSPRVTAELWGARYRLGASDDINKILNLLDSADEDLATPILNLLADLTERKSPATLKVDAPRVRHSLETIQQRLPILRSHAQEIIDHLWKDELSSGQ